MKIIIATPYFHPQIGGLEQYAEHIARQLVELGWEVHIVTSGQQTEDQVWDGMTIHRFRRWAVLSNTPVSPLWSWQTRRLIGRIKPDVINVHAPVPSMALAVAAAIGRVPLVVTYHAGSMKKGRAGVDAIISVYESWLLPRLLRRANAIICASDFVRESFLTGWQTKSVTITPGVDTELFHPIAAVRKSPRVLFVGDFRDPRKGLAVLLDAMKELPGVSLRVVGNGTPAPQPRVRFLGIKRGQALVREIQQASVLILPSTTEAESFGMVLIEAMACGIPVIGSDIGGIPRVIANGKDGLLVMPGNAAKLRDTITHLMSQPAFGEQLGRAGRNKAVQQFSWKKRGQATHDALQRAIAQAKEANRG